MTELLSEITFCDECPYSGEPNGCNRKEGVCKAHESYFDLVEENATLRERLTKAIKDVAERIKTAFYCEFEELIPSIVADRIDGIVKEVLNEHDL